MSESPFVITEEVFDASAPALAALIGLTALDTQLEALADIENELRTSLALWHPDVRGRAVEDLLNQIQRVRNRIDSMETVLKGIQA